MTAEFRNSRRSSGPVRGPGFVSLGTVPPRAEEALAACTERAGCRLFRASGPAAEGDWAVQGEPDQLAALRVLVAPLGDLAGVAGALGSAVDAGPGPDPLPPADQDLYRRRQVDEEDGHEAGSPPTLLITREFSFDAAHNLPRYDGKCERLHGHNYRVRVTVKAPLDAWSGLCFDFHDIKTVVRERVVDVLDHRYLNEFLPNPSAEHLAVWCWQRLESLPLHEIQIWETPTSYVTYRGPSSFEG